MLAEKVGRPHRHGQDGRHVTELDQPRDRRPHSAIAAENDGRIDLAVRS